MIDIHVHLLPGVDDGPGNLDEARAMCAIAAADGVTLAVATPHQFHERWANDDPTPLKRAYAELVLAAGGRPALALGAEIRIGSGLLARFDRESGGGLLTLGRSRALLLEPPPLPVGPKLVDVAHELAVAGYTPVIAHPERVPWLADDLDLLGRAADCGALIQLTAMSVTGELGRRARTAARNLLDAGLVHVVASDGHDPVCRPPRLRAAYEHVAAGWGDEVAERLFVRNPGALLGVTASGGRAEAGLNLSSRGGETM